MRVQFDADSVRIRLDHAEFARLRAGERLAMSVALVDAVAWSVSVEAGAAPGVAAEDGFLAATFATADLDAFASTLPSRHGLTLEWPRPGRSALRITLDVDVRDSLRAREPR